MVAPLDELEERFSSQRKAFARNPYPSLEERRKALAGVRAACAYARERLAAALAADFGSHDPSIGLLWELGGVLARIRYTSEHLEAWMQPSEREVDPMLNTSAGVTLQ